MKKPLFFAGVSGCVILVVSLLSFVLSLFIDFLLFDLLIILISLFFGISFYLGFVHLGKKFDNQLLVVLSWIVIIFTVLVSILALVGIIFESANLTGMVTSGLNESVNNLPEDLDMLFDESMVMTLLLFFIIIWLVVSIIGGIYFVLFGIALIKLDKNGVELAKVTGIFDIVAGLTIWIFIGILIGWVSFILKIILLFMASNKFEN